MWLCLTRFTEEATDEVVTTNSFPQALKREDILKHLTARMKFVPFPNQRSSGLAEGSPRDSRESSSFGMSDARSRRKNLPFWNFPLGLGTDYNFIGGGGEQELNAMLAIGTHRFREVEG
jgi:hypothetical protein